MSCNCTFYDYLGTCPDDIIYINTPLTEGQTYYWKITDKFGNEYTGSAVATATQLPIDTSGLPTGLLNKHGGTKLVEVYMDAGYTIRRPLLMSKYYDGVTFDVRHNTSNDSDLGTQLPECVGGQFSDEFSLEFA